MNRVISRINIESLFGRYDYHLVLQEGGDTSTPCVSLLYGDNGTGKTTILELVHHLLSPGFGQGHNTFVARTPFRLIEIEFSDNTRVAAKRQSSELIGNFDFEVSPADGTSRTATIVADPDGRFVTFASLSRRARQVVASLSYLDLDVLYLGDSRNLESDLIDRRQPSEHLRPRVFVDIDPRDSHLHRNRDPRWQVPPLAESIQRTDEALKQEAIRASSTGETNAQESNVDILRTIASANAQDAEILDQEVSNLQHRLAVLEANSKEFARFGLVPVIETEPLSEILASANPATLPVVVQVLRSILDGQQQRMNALNATYEKMLGLVNTVNAYLTDKMIDFDLYDGLTINLPKGLPETTLDAESLSSGEKHLLLILLNVLRMRDKPQLFLIDEPELSLNVKWQRRLVDSLLGLSKDSRCQFILATHSIELLTNHSDKVVEVNPHVQ